MIVSWFCLTAVAETARQVPTDSDFEQLRTRWRNSLTGGGNVNFTDPDTSNQLALLSFEAQSDWERLESAPNRTFLWRDLSRPSVDPGQMWSTYRRLETMTQAYATRGSGLRSNRALLQSLIAALDWMNTNSYSASKNEFGNWWYWEIGVPLCLNNITLLLGDELSREQKASYMKAVERFTPQPKGTAANLVWTATVVALRGAIVNDAAKIQQASLSLSGVFPFVTHGDGFYVDGSFIQHGNFAYTGSYGSSLLGCLSQILVMLDHSPWQVTDPQVTNVFQWISHAYAPVIFRGAMLNLVRGRAISRADETDRAEASQTMSGIIRLAKMAPPNEAKLFQSLIKQWLQSESISDFAAHASISDLSAAKAILADPAMPSGGFTNGHFQFNAMNRVVQLRRDFAFGISMRSSRIANYESINGENLHGWHTAAGMTSLYNLDEGQFDDDFWPTVDAARLPGTTVDRKSRADGAGAGMRGHQNWVGGVSLGANGAAGMQLDTWDSDLTAKKSWFMFEDQIICLGAGIRSTNHHAVETIVDNRKLAGPGTNDFLVNGFAKSGAGGWSETLTNVSWCHLRGTTDAADIGYYFPQRTALSGLRESRIGSWTEINRNERVSPATITRNYLTLCWDHGTNPVDGTYAYVLLPGKSAAQTAAYSAAPRIEVLKNSDNVQAVKECVLGLTAANFWNDAIGSVGGITVNRKSAVILQETTTNLVVAIADPTQVNPTGITLRLNFPATRVVSLDEGITVQQLRPAVELVISTAGAAGKTFHAVFSR